MSERLLAAFPGLRTSPFRITSPNDPVYNCIAFAAGSVTHWWWPLGDVHRFYWPKDVPREVSLDAFVSAFNSLGFVNSHDDSLEPGFEKVTLFADSTGVPTHAARQLATGRWTSKLGQSEDIEHDLHALEGEVYGKVVLILRRPKQSGSQL